MGAARIPRLDTDLHTTLDSATLQPMLDRLKDTNDAFLRRFPGTHEVRQPVHTVYGGANLYKPGAASKLGALALKHMDVYAPDLEHFARNLGLDFADPIVAPVFQRVLRKLKQEPIEDHRVDFEDGYGTRTDKEEDGHVKTAASAMADGLVEGSLPQGVGIRIKALSEESKLRSLRTLDLFISSLVVAAKGRFPDRFLVTLPKVTSATQVDVLCEAITMLEARTGLTPGAIQVEIMLESVQVLFNEQGQFGLRELVAAHTDRITTLVLGTFDYTASANISAAFQAHDHGVADFARQMMIAGLMDSTVNLCDGVTNLMPIPPHRGDALSDEQTRENDEAIITAWQLHFGNILHSMKLGIYQGWDLNPAQLPIRYAAVFYFYLKALAEAQQRLKTFVGKAAQASLTGSTFDDAATGQGLVNFFRNGYRCGALEEHEVLAAGVSIEELERGSFVEIVANRNTGERA